MKYCSTFFSILFLIIGLSGQMNGQYCGVKGKHRLQLREVPEGLRSRLQEVPRLPVVVHIVWRLPEENVSDLQVHAQLDALNADFRKRNFQTPPIPEEFRELAADAGLEFCLAERDPQGNPTTGITRTATSEVAIGDARALDGRRKLFFNELGGQDAWPVDRYINIYVCDFSFLGIATAAADTALLNTPQDGIIMNYRNFGTLNLEPPYHLGTTLTHEMGHYFGLAHPWGSDVGDCEEDDGIADTPLQGHRYLGQCPGVPQFSCGSSDMYMNFMNFTDDACLSLFSPGQRDYMQSFLLSRRPGLLEEPSFCAPESPSDILQESAVRLFPNPTLDFLNLEINLAEDKRISWALYDSLGRRILQGRRAAGDFRPLDVREVAAGWYVLEVSAEEEVLRIPLLKF